MSNIPLARNILKDTLAWSLPVPVRDNLTEALALMTRKSPEFVARRTIPPLTEPQKAQAILLRKGGMGVNDIARRLGTNIGRVSEAINEE
jgi:hypothetical protein